VTPLDYAVQDEHLDIIKARMWTYIAVNRQTEHGWIDSFKLYVKARCLLVKCLVQEAKMNVIGQGEFPERA
jgi:hypothetical protein